MVQRLMQVMAVLLVVEVVVMWLLMRLLLL